MKLGDIDIAKLLPAFMRESEDNIAFANAVSEVVQEQAKRIDRLSIWGYLDSFSGEELDRLADDLNIFWYDVSLPDEKKRDLIANSDKVYMTLGTKYAVEEVVSNIFGPSEIEEFFEYGGRPHYFRIKVDNPENMTPENEAKLLRVLEKVKRKSQWLEGIQNEILADISLFVGMSVAIHDVTEITFDTWQDNMSAKANAGLDLQFDQEGMESPGINFNR